MATKPKPTKKPKSTKYVFVVGGVMSGVGKGISSASLGLLLKSHGLNVTAIKIDPYINVDAGTMNPTEHGEVFVLDAGLETDQDMGNYERFLDQDLPAINYMTTGSVYLSVIEQERNLAYEGKNVEVVPDIPKEVIRRIIKAGEVAQADVVLVEVGGTVGEYQNVLFLEAIRMMKQASPEAVATILVSYLPVPGSIGEMKTKPTQTAVRMLNSAGVFADFIIARSPVPIDQKRKDKLATFCNVKADNVIAAPDVASVYDIPLQFATENFAVKLGLQLGLKLKSFNLDPWKKFTTASKRAQSVVKIAVVGKYFKTGDFILADVYLSVLEAIKYSAYAAGLKPDITYLSAADFTTANSLKKLQQYDGVLIPGGFGTTGVVGKLNVIRYVREQKIPYFGICYGLQLAVVEFARSRAGLKRAHTTEIDPDTPDPVVAPMPEQLEILATQKLGGTMRLGAYEAELEKGSLAFKAYGMKDRIIERHRHRFEVNPSYHEALTKAGLNITGTSAKGRLAEIIELPKSAHPFFLAVQFHPEFLARPLRPHPLFTAFVKAASKHRKK